MQLPKPDNVSFETCPAGTHVAVCYRFVDLGTQRYQHPGGPRHQHKVMLSWELPEALIQDGDYAGKPFTFHQQYTWSMNEKATLRRHLESWRGIPFREEDFGENGCDTRDLLGKPCMLTLAQSSQSFRAFVSLQGISRLVKGKQPPGVPHNPITYFSMGGTHIDMLTFDRLSEKVKATIQKSPEYERLTHAVPMRIWKARAVTHAETLYSRHSQSPQPAPDDLRSRGSPSIIMPVARRQATCQEVV